ncbi:putative alpha/Beta hydrolase [Helianthus annuus]|uniref:Alpha/Beta hydrolase n=2 Tax=Helianthus annuus TaxID=4232 RepID=A0A9K3JZU5_HELAN|nr:putative alpha/Beta hydrolase [Helianthus annuus]KAJ0613078.1 putative alpha/Beta hydrolase [Helianthus annuus]KAJ0624786.1 putative alpha/Beta hydrolase [Helianthus annuus]KAJ0784752.1 putative alpha/Beta hydrolase [Helianthus annuus]KAJ0794019.1 putative alpha/Beta hydrolase [Helianthus annuus]
MSTIIFCNGSKWVLVYAHAKYECINYITLVRKMFTRCTLLLLLFFLFDLLFEKCESIVSLFVFMKEQVRQQGEYESLHRVNIGFGTWEFDPTEIENPFTENEEFVHIWQGDEDILVPVTLQQNIAQQLPWIKYHELTSVGHMFPYAEGNSDAILKALLLGQS